MAFPAIEQVSTPVLLLKLLGGDFLLRITHVAADAVEMGSEVLISAKSVLLSLLVHFFSLVAVVYVDSSRTWVR